MKMLLDRQITPAAALGARMRLLAVLAASLLFLSACYTPAASRFITRTADGSVPWWCQGSPDLSTSECLTFSAYADGAVEFAYQRWTYQDGINAGGTVWAGDSRVLLFGAAASFDPAAANLIEYESTDPGARAIGVGWRIADAIAPEGFPGARDTWVADGTAADTWILRLWVLRGYENHPDVFAATHPCQASLPLTSTTDACFLASHTEPLDLLITNDDGYDSEGIDALVQAIVDDPNDPSDSFVPGVTVTVVAPLTPQSGQGSNKTPGGATTASTGLTTLSGFPVEAAVHGTPVDTSVWALENLSLSPDLVISGINEGQNINFVGDSVSGTIGAARAAARRATDAIATSQGVGNGVPPDFESGAEATLALLEQWRIGAAGLPRMELPNINIPTCAPGSSIRGTVETIVGEALDGRPYGPADCFSTEPPGVDDSDGFLRGFTTIADMGKVQPPNYP